MEGNTVLPHIQGYSLEPQQYATNASAKFHALCVEEIDFTGGIGNMDEKITIREDNLREFLTHLKEHFEKHLKARYDYIRVVKLVVWVAIYALGNTLNSLFFDNKSVMLGWTLLYLSGCFYLFWPIYNEFKKTKTL